MVSGQVAERYFIDLLKSLEQHEGAAEGQGEEEREEPAGGGAERRALTRWSHRR